MVEGTHDNIKDLHLTPSGGIETSIKIRDGNGVERNVDDVVSTSRLKANEDEGTTTCNLKGDALNIGKINVGFFIGIVTQLWECDPFRRTVSVLDVELAAVVIIEKAHVVDILSRRVEIEDDLSTVRIVIGDTHVCNK